MCSASDKFLSVIPSQSGVGPHAARLIHEAQMAVRAKLWVSVIVLAATMVDVIKQEDQIFDVSGDDEFSDDQEYDYQASTDYFEAGGYDYLTSGERKKLDWLRGVRNQLVHYEGPIEGMLGRPSDEGTLAQMADKALSAILPILEQT